MAYKKEDMIKQTIDAIKKYDLIYISEIFTFVSFSSRAFYSNELHKKQTIIKELEGIKIKTKQYLRSEWKKSKSPFLQNQLYKLCANDDELARLRIGEGLESGNSEETLKKLSEISDKLDKE